jgi:hypothetical protein
MAQAAQAQHGGTLDTVVLELGLVDEDTLADALATAWGTEPVSRAHMEQPTSAATSLMPASVAVALHVCPLSVDDDALHVLVEAPLDGVLVNDVAALLQRPLVAHVVPAVWVARALSSAYGAPVDERMAALRAQPMLEAPTGLSLASAMGAIDAIATRDDGLRDDILDVTLRFARQVVPFAAVFGVRNGALHGWRREGATTSAQFGARALPVPVDGALAALLHTPAPSLLRPQGTSGDLALFGWLGRRVAPSLLLVPVVVGGQVRAVFAADGGQSLIDTTQLTELLALVLHLGPAFEALLLRRRHARVAASITRGEHTSTPASDTSADQGVEQDVEQLVRRFISENDAEAAPSTRAGDVVNGRRDGTSPFAAGYAQAPEGGALLPRTQTPAATSRAADDVTGEAEPTSAVWNEAVQETIARSLRTGEHLAVTSSAPFFEGPTGVMAIPPAHDTSEGAQKTDPSTPPSAPAAPSSDAGPGSIVSSSDVTSALSPSDVASSLPAVDAEPGVIAITSPDVMSPEPGAHIVTAPDAAAHVVTASDAAVPEGAVSEAALVAFDVGGESLQHMHASHAEVANIAAALDEALGDGLMFEAERSDTWFPDTQSTHVSADIPTSTASPPLESSPPSSEAVLAALAETERSHDVMHSAAEELIALPGASSGIDVPVEPLASDAPAPEAAVVDAPALVSDVVETPVQESDVIASHPVHDAPLSSTVFVDDSSVPDAAALATPPAAPEEAPKTVLVERVISTSAEGRSTRPPMPWAEPSLDDVPLEALVDTGTVMPVVAANASLTPRAGERTMGQATSLDDLPAVLPPPTTPPRMVDDGALVLDDVVPDGAPSLESLANDALLLEDEVGGPGPNTDVVSLRDMDPIASLVEELWSTDAGTVRRAQRELVELGASAMPLLVARFPGPLLRNPLDPRVDMQMLPGELGPLLDVVHKLGVRGVEVAMTALEHTDPKVRVAAALVCARTPDPRAIEALRVRLADTEPRVRSLVVEALTPLANHPLFQPVSAQLRERLKSSQAEPRRRAIQLLQTFRDADAVPDLVALLDKKDDELADDVRKALRTITGQDHGRRSKPWQQWWARSGSAPRASWLIEGLASDDRSLRSLACGELGKLAGSTFGFDVDGSRRDRELAAQRFAKWAAGFGKS